MSWAEEDWTLGLSGQIAQKVKELQVHQERMSRENKQKQLQLDNVCISLEKQTAKNEEIRGELQSVQREVQMVRDEAKAAVTTRERLSQELQTKQAQVCSLEGQLDAARTLNNKLSEEVKRLEAELEKLQNSSRSTDTTPFSTPCWSATSPWEHNGRKEERRRYRDEGQSQVPNSRQQLQFSEEATSSCPQSLTNTPQRHPSDQSESFSTPLALFPWERDDSRPAARRRSPISPQTPCSDVIIPVRSEQGVCGKEKDSRKETDMSVSAMQQHVSALEEELRLKAAKMKSIQNELSQIKKETTAKELSLQRAREELSQAHTRIAQESERATGAEQRSKQLQEELKCQRQNSESSRLQYQQRTKDLEKQHQRDLSELQKERQCLEKQHHQEVNRLNQELHQARTLHNALQAQADKLSLQKQALDKELDTLKEKLKWTEVQLQESQNKEAQTQAKLTAAVREAEGVALSLEQSRKKERALEEEGRRLAKELADALRLVKELQEQKVEPAPTVQLIQGHPVGRSFSPPPSYSPHSQTSTHIKHSPAKLPEQKREDSAVRRREKITSVHKDIDSEDVAVLMSPDSESLQREGNSECNVEKRGESRQTISTFDCDTVANTLIDRDQCNLLLSAENSLQRSEVDEDLKRENAALRSELHDIREELHKRLDDLDAQRRAEAEARTRLKQLSRKLASQSVEKGEQDKEWKLQLEREKAETEKLRKAMAALEMENKKGREAREENERQEAQEEEKYKALEDRESEMIELNIQLKKQLAEVKAQLALEREEKMMSQINTDIDEKNTLNMKIEELKAELEELKLSRKDSLEEKLSVSTSPLLYLTLRDDELNSNKLPSPEQHLLFCQSTNQRNTLVTQATSQLIQEQELVIDAEPVPHVASDIPATRQDCPVEFSLSDDRQVQKDGHAPSDLEKVVEHLQKKLVKETENANQYQLKLEALQGEVTYQTQQLTTEFEKQSQYIASLLAELQEKDSALLALREELQHHKLENIKSQNAQEENKELTAEDAGQKEDEREEIFGPQPSEEKLETVTCDAEGRTSVRDNKAPWSGEQHAGSVKSDKTQSDHVQVETLFGQAEVTTDVAIEQKERTLGSSTSKVRSPYVHSEEERDEVTVGPAALPSSAETRSPAALYEITTETQHSEDEKICDEGNLEGEDAMNEEEQIAESEISYLQQQVVELQMKLQALSAVAQQQQEEIAIWRLASQPPPVFDLPYTEEQSETQNQICSVTQPQSDRTDEGLSLGVQGCHGGVTVIRTDELFLSCSSNKLQGQMLFSSLQQTSASLDITEKESEKESQEINNLNQLNSYQHKEETDAADIQQHSTKEPEPSWTRTDPEYRPAVSIATSEADTAEEMSERADRTQMKSVSVQTDDSAPTAPELRSVHTQTEEEGEDESVESPPLSPVALPPRTEGEDQVLFSGSFPIPADPARLAERIRRNRTQLSAAFDDTEYEPYGLPEVVMKGFADIPSGASCPYIVRRGLLGTTVLPVIQNKQVEEDTD